MIVIGYVAKKVYSMQSTAVSRSNSSHHRGEDTGKQQEGRSHLFSPILAVAAVTAVTKQ